MFVFIVRGLYYRSREVVLPTDCKFDVRRLLGKDVETWWSFFEEHGYNGPYAIGEGVFRCAFQYAEKDDAITFWMLSFYNRVFYLVVTTPVEKHAEDAA